jgi:hypothetical protein
MDSLSGGLWWPISGCFPPMGLNIVLHILLFLVIINFVYMS